MGYLEDRAARKNGLLPKMVFAKPKKPLKKVSDKKAAEMKAADAAAKSKADALKNKPAPNAKA